MLSIGDRDAALSIQTVPHFPLLAHHLETGPVQPLLPPNLQSGVEVKFLVEIPHLQKNKFVNSTG